MSKEITKSKKSEENKITVIPEFIEIFVDNPITSSEYYRRTFGFELVARKDNNPQNPHNVSLVLKNQLGSTCYVFTNPSLVSFPVTVGVKNYSVRVNNVIDAYNLALENGAIPIAVPHRISDSNGEVMLATVKSDDVTIHTFIKNISYNGSFLPGYIPANYTQLINYKY